MEILGFFCALLIGIFLGLLGGGGSILTLPVLVYLLGISPLLSTTYGLFVIGTTSLIGSVDGIRKQQVHYPAVLLFSLPSVSIILFIRRYVLSAIPDFIRVTDTIWLYKGKVFMLLFAVVMLGASLLMLRDRKHYNLTKTLLSGHDYVLLALSGVLIGSLTGLAGIGGGFLIIPALVVVVGLPMKRAIGTSLVIIGVNSLIGFLSDTRLDYIHWPFLLAFTTLAVLGIVIGSYLSRFISGIQLRKGFGWFIMGLSLIILGKEL